MELIQQFDLLASSLGGVAKLRELILSLAVRGKLVPQDPADEPASVLLQKIRAEKDRLIVEGKIKKDKPLLPISDEEKQFEMPEGWEWVRFGNYIHELCTGPFGSMIHKEDYVSGGTPLINPSHMIGGKIAPDFDISLPNSKAAELGAYRLAEGDIVMARRGEVGRYALVTKAETGWLCGTGSFFIKLSELISRTFIGLMLSSPSIRNYLQGESVGSTMVNLNQRILLEMPIALPPLLEQSRIVAKVDELMALCDRLEAEQEQAAQVQGHWMEAALAQLADSADANEFARHWHHLAQHFDTLFTTPDSITQLEATLLQLAVRGKLVPQDPSDEPASTLLQKMRTEKNQLIAEGKIKKDKPLPPISGEEISYESPEGWCFSRLADVTLNLNQGLNTAGQNIEYVDIGVKILQSKNITKGKIDLVDAKSVSTTDYNTYSDRFSPRQRDILFTNIGTIGKSLVFDTQDNILIAWNLFLIRPSSFLNEDYLKIHLDYFESTGAYDKITSGSATKFINKVQMSSMAIAIPPLSEQSRIVAKVESLFALTAGLKAQLSKAQQMQAVLADVLIETST